MVHRVRCGDINHIHLWIGRQSRVTGMGMRGPELGGKLSGLAGRPRPHGHQPGIRHRLQAPGEFLRDFSQP